MLISGATTSFQQISEIRRKLGIGPLASGVPIGGAINTVLTKLSAVDYDTGWAALLGGLITAGNGITFAGNTVHFAQAAAYTAGAIPFATGVATMGFDAANLFWDAANGFLGIGTNAPTGRLEVLETRSDALDYAMDHQVLTSTVSGGTKRAFAVGIATSGAANFAAGLLSGGLSSSAHDGAGNVTGTFRVICHEMYHGKGLMGTGNMDASIGLYVQSVNANAVGAITTTYDIYIPTPFTTGAITTNYPIYQVNPAGINYFGGLVRLNLMTQGSVLFTGALGQITQDNANLFYDPAIGFLGLGVAVPTVYAERFYLRQDYADAVDRCASHVVINTSVPGGWKYALGVGLSTTGAANFNVAGPIQAGLFDCTHGSSGTNTQGIFALKLIHGSNVAGTGLVNQTCGLNIQAINLSLVGTITTVWDLFIQTPDLTGGGVIGTNYAIYQESTSAYNFLGGNLSIATATFNPSIPLRIQKTLASVAAVYGTYCDINQAPAGATAAQNTGGFFQLQTSGANNFTLATNTLVGVMGSAYHASTGTCGQVVGGYTYATRAAAGGVVSALVGFRTGITNSAGTAVPTGYGYYVAPPTVGAGIGTYYGLYVDAPAGTTSYGLIVAASTAATAYGILQLGTVDLNYFAGFTAFGSTSPVNTTFALFGAATAAIASLRITAGVAPPATSGNVYSTGTHLYWVDAGAVRQQLDGLCTLTGAVDPNGVVTGILGQIYTEIPGDGSATLWINTDGATTWV
jgi:hypothetical protein